MVGVGQVPLPGLRGRQLGAVMAQDVGEHGDRLARVRAARPGRGLARQVSQALKADSARTGPVQGRAGCRAAGRRAWPGW